MITCPVSPSAPGKSASALCTPANIIHCPAILAAMSHLGGKAIILMQLEVY